MKQLPVVLVLVALLVSACGGQAIPEQQSTPVPEATATAPPTPTPIPPTSTPQPTAEDTATPTQTPALYQTYDIWEHVWECVVADFDGDSYPDLAAADEGSNALRLFFNNGDGTFQDGVDYAGGAGMRAVIAADLDGDSYPDLAFTQGAEGTGEGGIGMLSVLLNDGTGKFQTSADYATSADTWWLSAADLDGDSDVDLVADLTTAQPQTGDGGVGVWLNNGDGTFQEGERTFFDVLWVGNAVAGELNGDACADVAVRHYPEPRVSVLLNNGDATLGAPVDYQVGRELHDLMIADLNGDGHADLAAVSELNTVSVLLNNGDGTFQESVDYEKVGQSPHGVAASDINGDGHVDLLVPGYRNQKVHVLLNDGDGAFRLGEEYHAGFTTDGAFVTDLDGDSQPELLVSGSRKVKVLPIKGGE